MNAATYDALERLERVCCGTPMERGQVIVDISDLRKLLAFAMENNKRTPGEIDRANRKVAAYDAVVGMLADAVREGSR